MPRIKGSPIKNSKKLVTAKRFRLTKLQVAFIALIFSVVGLVFIYQSLASSVPASYPTTYPSCTPMCHTTGLYAGYREEFYNILVNVPIWNWPAGLLSNSTNYAYQTAHYLQYGPYVTVTIPSNMHGLHVCYYYSGYGKINDGNGYLRLLANLNYTGIAVSNDVTWYSGEPKFVTAALAPQMQTYCINYPLQPGRTYTNVEYRLKVISTTDKDAELDLWKTTVSYY